LAVDSGLYDRDEVEPSAVRLRFEPCPTRSLPVARAAQGASRGDRRPRASSVVWRSGHLDGGPSPGRRDLRCEATRSPRSRLEGVPGLRQHDLLLLRFGGLERSLLRSAGLPRSRQRAIAPGTGREPRARGTPPRSAPPTQPALSLQYFECDLHSRLGVEN